MQGVEFSVQIQGDLMGLHQIFLKNFRLFFEATGKTKREFARAMDAHESDVNRWLKGEREPSMDRVGDIAAALGLLPRDLLYDPKNDAEMDKLTSDIAARTRYEQLMRIKIAQEIAAPAGAVVKPIVRKPRVKKS